MTCDVRSGRSHDERDWSQFNDEEWGLVNVELEEVIIIIIIIIISVF